MEIENIEDFEKMVSKRRKSLNFKTCVLRAFNPNGVNDKLRIDLLGDSSKSISLNIDLKDFDFVSVTKMFIDSLIKNHCKFYGFKIYRDMAALRWSLDYPEVINMDVYMDGYFASELVTDDYMNSESMEFQDSVCDTILNFCKNIESKLKEEGLWEYWWNIRKTFCTKVFYYMHVCGLKISKRKFEHIRTDYKNLKDRLDTLIHLYLSMYMHCDKLKEPYASFIREHLHDKDINEIKPYIIKALGLKPLFIKVSRGKYTKVKIYDPEVDKDPEPKDIDITTDSLRAYRGIYSNWEDLFDLLLLESYVSHTLKTFLSLNMYKHIGDDSRVHPLYDFTVTGRPISSGPCILNIPKELPKEFLDLNKFKDLGVNIYDIFFDCINMDNCIRSYDYKSAEMYALAYLSEDVKMQSAVANSDPHWMVAKSLFKNKDKIPEIYRVAGKISNYAIPYGITDESLDIKIMSLLGINIVGLGSKLKKAYAKNFPNAWKYLENNCYLNKSKSLYESPLGFKKDFKDVFDNKRGIRQIRNFPMQNLVADALQLACNKCVDYLYENGIELSMAQYDSIVLSSPKKEDLDKANDIVKDAMENCFEHFKGIKDLRMKVEIEDIRNV